MNVSRRTVALILSASALSLSVTACGSGHGSSAHSLEKVRFGYIADYNGTSLLAIANKQGLWKKAGLDPKLSVFTNGPLQIQALNSRSLDFGYIGPGAVWLPASGHSKIIAVDTLTYADRVIAQPGITSIKQLRGKKVGYPAGTSGEMVLNLALQSAGMTEKDIDAVPMDPATIVSAFLSGKIAGAGIWYPLISSIKAKKPNLNEIASTKDFKGRAFPTAFVAGNKTSPELTKKVLTVLEEANDWRQAHPKQSIAEAATILKEPVASVASDATHVTTLSTADLVAKTKDGTVDNWLKGLTDFFVSTKQLKTSPDPKSYYTGDLFTQAYAKERKASAR
jgi:NitT/TauT family transport system substrate-binding protein